MAVVAGVALAHLGIGPHLGRQAPARPPRLGRLTAAAPSAGRSPPADRAGPPSPGSGVAGAGAASGGGAHGPGALQVAAAFASAYLTYRWDDAGEALAERCRPWDTDELDATLAGPGGPPDSARRAGARETDQVEIRAVNPQDTATDHMDATVAAAVTVTVGDRPPVVVAAFVDLRVVALSGRWLVSEVS